MYGKYLAQEAWYAVGALWTSAVNIYIISRFQACDCKYQKLPVNSILSIPTTITHYKPLSAGNNDKTALSPPLEKELARSWTKMQI